MASLDLRPAKGSLLYEFLRLGLVFDHSDGDTQTWMDYAKGIRADITGVDATEVTLTDTTSRLSKTVAVSDLQNATSVITWKSDCPIAPATSGE